MVIAFYLIAIVVRGMCDLEVFSGVYCITAS